jgi:hypothetical protein
MTISYNSATGMFTSSCGGTVNPVTPVINQTFNLGGSSVDPTTPSDASYAPATLTFDTAATQLVVNGAPDTRVLHDLYLDNDLYLTAPLAKIELAHGLTGKTVSSGLIAYQGFSAGLDIFGVGVGPGASRVVKLWDDVQVQNGLSAAGDITSATFVNAPGVVASTSVTAPVVNASTSVTAPLVNASTSVTTPVVEATTSVTTALLTAGEVDASRLGTQNPNGLIRTSALPVKHTFCLTTVQRDILPYVTDYLSLNTGGNYFLDVGGCIPYNFSNPNYSFNRSGPSAFMPDGFFMDAYLQNNVQATTADPSIPPTYTNYLTDNDMITYMRVVFQGGLLNDSPAVDQGKCRWSMRTYDYTGNGQLSAPMVMLNSDGSGTSTFFGTMERTGSRGAKHHVTGWIKFDQFPQPTVPSLYLCLEDLPIPSVPGYVYAPPYTTYRINTVHIQFA